MAVFVYYMYEIYLFLHRKHAVKLLSFQFFGSVGCLFSNNVARLLVLILFRLNVAVYSIGCVCVFFLFIFFGVVVENSQPSISISYHFPTQCLPLLTSHTV